MFQSTTGLLQAMAGSSDPASDSEQSARTHVTLFDYDNCFADVWGLVNGNDFRYGVNYITSDEFQRTNAYRTCVLPSAACLYADDYTDKAKETIAAFMTYLASNFPKEHEEALKSNVDDIHKMKGLMVAHIFNRFIESAENILSHTVKTCEQVQEILPASMRSSKARDDFDFHRSVFQKRKNCDAFSRALRRFSEDITAAKTTLNVPFTASTIIDLKCSLQLAFDKKVPWDPTSVPETALFQDETPLNTDFTKLFTLIPMLQWIGRKYSGDVSVEFLDDSLRSGEKDGTSVWLMREAMTELKENYADLIPRNVHLSAICLDAYSIVQPVSIVERINAIVASGLAPESFDLFRCSKHCHEHVSVQGTGEFLSDFAMSACADLVSEPCAEKLSKTALLVRAKNHLERIKAAEDMLRRGELDDLDSEGEAEFDARFGSNEHVFSVSFGRS